jgi:tetratricopeptide (TPR) repeat protein
VASNLMNKMANFSGASPDALKQSRRLIETSLALLQGNVPDDDLGKARRLSKLAVLLHAMEQAGLLRDMDQNNSVRHSRKLAAQAVDMCERLCGDADKEVGVALIGQARILKDSSNRNDVEAARLCCERALKIYAATESVRRAFAERCRGEILTTQGKLDEAVRAFQDARELYLEKFDKDHPTHARTLVGVADVLLKQREAKEARKILEDAYRTFVLYGDSEAEGIADCERRFGDIASLDGKHDEARIYWTRAYDRYYKFLGEKHPKVRALARQLRSIAPDYDLGLD